MTVALAGVLSGDRPPALVSIALTRARFCELLAPTLSQDPQQGPLGLIESAVASMYVESLRWAADALKP
jgi:c-di-GMP-related signal transduction protein